MGEYAEMAVEHSLSEWEHDGYENDYIPASAWIPKGKIYIIGELIESRETEKAWCVRFLMEGELCPPVFIPKSKCKLKKNGIWMPYWLAAKKTEEIRAATISLQPKESEE